MEDLPNNTGCKFLDLFDCHCAFGSYSAPGLKVFRSASHIRAEMDRVGIGEALVYSNVARECDTQIGNNELLRAVAVDDRLHPAWVLTPDLGSWLPSFGERVDRMLQAGVRAAYMFPTFHQFTLSPWQVDGLLSELSEHRVPLFLDFGNKHWSERLTDWDAVDAVCGRFPELPVVMVHEGLASVRTLTPLLARNPNLHVEISYFQPNTGIKVFAQEFGPDRLLFGTGMPVYDPGCPISMIAYAPISVEWKQAIAGCNLRRLLGGVC